MALYKCIFGSVDMLDMYGFLSMSLLLYGSAALGKLLYVFLDQRFHILLAWLLLPHCYSEHRGMNTF